MLANPTVVTAFSGSIESTRTYRYACLPHRSLGQKGAIVVE